MKAKKKPIDEKTPAELGVDLAPRLKVLKVTEPKGQRSGTRVASAAELVEKLTGGTGPVTTLLIAEHDKPRSRKRRRGR